MERECEHAAQMLDERRAVLFVEMDRDLDVALGPESMSPGFQSGPQLTVVVDLTVQHDRNVRIFVVDGLVSVRDTDDAETPHAEPDTGLQEEAAIIGATVHHGIGHGPESRLRDLSGSE